MYERLLVSDVLKVVLAGYYPPPFGGESIHVWKLAYRLRTEGLLDLVVNLRRGAPRSADYVNGASLVRFWGVLMRELSGRKMLHLHTNGHSWKSWARIICAASVLRIRGKPGVLTLHSGMCPEFVDGINVFGSWLLRYALAAFTEIICVNDEIQETLVGLGVSRAQLSVVPAFMGAVPGVLDTEDEAMLEGYRPLLSVVAGVGPEYGLPVLINALFGLKARYPVMKCTVLGTDGAGEAADLVQALDLSRQVQFLDQIPHARCLAFVACSHLFVRPSLVDGDALSVREALAMGIPVVASDTGLRPTGTILFRNGDSADLETKMRGVLDGAMRAKETCPAIGFGEAVLAVYDKAAREC